MNPVNYKIIIITLIIFDFFSIVISSKDHLWHSYQFGSGHSNREELVITKVEADVDFKITDNILKWKSLSLKHKSYALGLSENGVTLLVAEIDKNKNESFVTNSTHTNMNATVLDAIIFEYYNQDSKQLEVIAVIATNNTKNNNNSVVLLWYKITADNNLVQIWKWNLQKKILHMEHLKINNKHNILICNDHSENSTTADLYKFHLDSKPDFWLVQVISLEIPTNITAINKFGKNTFLSIPQENKVRIFQYTKDHFVPYKNLTVGHARWVDAFSIGFQSFLAVDGFNAGIYKFTQNGLEKQEVNANLDGIDFWLSIPLKTYRDEEILISERSLDHGSHTSHIIDLMLYHDGKFVVHDEMVCNYFKDIKNGISCLVEEETTMGIKGAAVLSIDNVLGILVPKNLNTRLFMVHYELKVLESPVQKKINSLNARKNKIQDLINQHKSIIQKTNESKKNMTDITREKISSRTASEAMVPPTLGQFSPAWSGSGIEKKINMEELTQRIRNIQNSLDNIKLSLAKLPLIHLRGNQFKNLIVNGLVEVQRASNIKTIHTKRFNDGFVDDVFGDIVRHDNINMIGSHKTFLNLETNAVTFNTVNGISAEKIAYKDASPLTIDGDLVFKNTVKVLESAETEKINDQILEDEVIRTNNIKKYEDSLDFIQLNITDTLNAKKANKFPIHEHYLDALVDETEESNLETMEFDTIYIPGNVTVQNINEDNLKQIVASLCLNNIKTYIPNETKILGDVNVIGDVQISKLNDLKYPEEYVFTTSDIFTKISGKKVFNNIIQANEIITHGTVNNIDPNKIITLSEEQTIPGIFKFDDLEITENLRVNGEIIGNNVNDFLPNPTLLETELIKSNINFKNLEVDGIVIVDNSFNGTNLYDVLDDVVYKDSERAVISSVKEFPNSLTVLSNLNLISNTINNIALDTLINKESEQEILAKTLNGVVTFENLIVTGDYGKINITKLDQETVKLTGEQFVSSKLFFEDTVIINELDVIQTLNDVPVIDYLFTNVDTILDNVEFDTIKANNIDINGNLLTNYNSINLEDFNIKRLSLTNDQLIPADVFINQSKIQNIKPVSINGYNFKDMFDVETYTKKISEFLFQGKLKIKDLIIHDSLNILKIDNVPIEEITKNCIRTQKESQLKSDLIFQNNVYFQEIAVDSLNGVNMDSFPSNLIYKNETFNVTIPSVKVYHNGFDVIKYITTPLLNDIKIENILRKSGEQHILGPFIIDGDIKIKEKAFINDFLNYVPIAYLTDTFEVMDSNTYKINSEVIVEKVAHILELQVDYLNDKNLTDFIDNIVHIHDDRDIPGITTFQTKVSVDGNLAINNKINGVDLSTFKDDIVLITQDAFVEGLVNFAKPVNITHELILESDLICPIINGIDLQQWKDKAVFIDRGVVLGNIVFEKAIIGDHLNVTILNNIDMNSLIPLRTEQTIEQRLYFQELASFKDIIVYNFVNGYNLEAEYHNTVLTGRIQQISSNVVFEGNVLVRGSLDIIGHVNEMDLSRIVTTKTPQNLTAKYEFDAKTTCNKQGVVYGLINGINMTLWTANGVKKYTPFPQHIINPWNIEKNITFGSNVIGVGVLSNMDIRKIATEVEEKRQFKDYVETKLLDDYYAICKDINGLLQSSRKQIYKFKYLEYHHIIDLVNPIENVHHFKFLDTDYVLIHEEKSCYSTLFIWSHDYLSPVQQIETGPISQIISVPVGDILYLVSRSDAIDSPCAVDGTILWKFETENILLTSRMDPLILLQESLVPGTFYGLSNDYALEFKISVAAKAVHCIRKWKLENSENGAFMPPGLKPGVSLINGKQMFELLSADSILEEEFGFDMNTVNIGNVTKEDNNFLPGRLGGDIVLINVGYPRRKTLVAVASHEETMVKGRNDFVKIYENIMLGTVYHTIPSYNPSSLISLEFGENGETLLIFLEDHKRIQIYEYKGIEGFKHRTTANVEATKIIPLRLNTDLNKNRQYFIGLINKNRFSLIKSVMDGDQVTNAEVIDCKL